MGEVDGVTGVHDLHFWSVAGDDTSLTAHVAVQDGYSTEAARRALVEMLAARFDIRHVTIQTEYEPCRGDEDLHA
jgi:Co/Zn/Cd efflux system component